MPGELVTFAAPSADATALLSSATALTNASGVASVTARSSSKSGTYQVTASATGAGTPATFNLTNTAGAVARIAATSGGGQSAQVLTQFAAPLVATVYDAFDNGVPGVSVAVEVPAMDASASLAPSSLISDGSGRVSVVATANGISGSYAASASVGGSIAPATFALSNQAGPPGMLTAVAGAAQSARVTTAYPVPLRVLVVDALGNPAPNVPVTFAAPVAGASATLSAGTVLTDATGHASATATAGTAAGAFDVTATAPGVATAVTFPLTNLPGVAVALVATAGDGQSTPIETPFAAALVATAQDAWGNPLAGEAVTFVMPASGPSSSLGTTVVSTDASGQVSVRATANQIAGSYVVAAQLAGGPGTAFTLTNTAGPVSVVVVQGGADQRTVVRTSYPSPLRVAVRDARDNPVPGVPVTFEAPSAGASVALDATTVTTDANGEASVMAVANERSGTLVVTATAVGAATPASIALSNLPGAVARLELAGGSGQSAMVETAFLAPLSVVARDALGNPVPSQDISFEAPGRDASARLGVGMLVTNAQGRADLVVTANEVAGSYEVVASLAGVAPVRFALTNTAGPVGTIEVTGGSGQSARVTAAFAAPLSVRVRDARGNPVPAVTVTFALPASGPTSVLAASEGVTDADGRVSIAARAGDRAGTYAVAASAPGAASPARFALENLSGSAAAIVVLEGSPQSARVKDAFATPLRIAVRDAQGNPVSGVAVTFAAPSSGASARLNPTRGVSDGDGSVDVVALANAVAGAYAVSATAEGVGQPATFALTNLVGTATRLVRLEGSDQRALVSQPFARPLTVAVRDANDNPVPAVVVQFTVPRVGASAALASSEASTDLAGVARVAAVANERAGGYEVTAALPGTEQVVRFALSNVATDCTLRSSAACSEDDADGDGVPNATDAAPGDPCVPSMRPAQCATGDADGDGIPNDLECPAPTRCPDSDGDGQPDILDTDSDGDGRGDAVECTSPRACEDDDRDGLPNYVESDVVDTDGDGSSDATDVDSDGDGIPDALEGRERPWLDADGDGIPSHLDADEDGPGVGDSDGDGVLDDAECPTGILCADTDRDGSPDYMDLDSDGDGVADAVDPARTNPCTPSTTTRRCVSPGVAFDADGDGLSDDRECASDPALEMRFRRARARVDDCPDTDADGIPDIIDADSDGDGLTDLEECPSVEACPDEDGDQIPDYLQPAPIKVAGGACALGGSLPDLAWLAGLGLLGLRARRRRRDRERAAGGAR